MSPVLLKNDPHDQFLLGNVHPPNWVNPVPAPRYHLVVIGAGTAGLVTAAGAAGIGAKVALIEKDLMGGDCLNVGCVPSKGIIRASRAAASIREAEEFGITVEGYNVDFPRVMERMRRLRAGISPHDSADRFQKLGVDVFLGEAKFSGPETIEVGGQHLKFRKAVIASGARPVKPEIPGLAPEDLLTNESVFALTEAPKRLVVIGAGPIGCELAQAFARLGSEVTLIGDKQTILPREDPDAAAIVSQSLARDRINLLLASRVERVEAGRILVVKTADGESRIPFDRILAGAGRIPNVEHLNLETVGVKYDPRGGVEVDDYLRSSNPKIFAAGDVCSQYKFTHAADAMARIVIRNALFRGSSKVSDLTIPWCTYTAPEVAHVGLSEEEAKKRNIPYRVFRQELSHVDRAILDGETEGFVKVLVHPKKDRILGATIVAGHAGEMISEISVAMAANLGLGEIGNVIHPYPTQAEAIKKLGDTYNKTRLTPFVKKILGTWLKWTA